MYRLDATNMNAAVSNKQDCDNSQSESCYDGKCAILDGKYFKIVTVPENKVKAELCKPGKKTLISGSFAATTNFKSHLKEATLIMAVDLSVAQEVVVNQAVHIVPAFLFLPLYNHSSTTHTILLKASGGTGFYTWTSTRNDAVNINCQTEQCNEAVIQTLGEGDFTITATDKQHSDFYSSAEISVKSVIEIDVYPTIVEAEIGNDIIIPVALRGFECNEKKISRVFEDCSKLRVSVDIVEKHIITYKKDADVPPFGKGCLSLQFLCQLPGHSRIIVYYTSEDTSSLKTTLVVACHKPLKPIHPVKVAVLALGTSKEVAFEGGPRPWPLFRDGHYMDLLAEKPQFVNISLIKDPVRYNKDLHVFNVICKEIGETVLKFLIGNKASATNQNPAKMESSVKIVCSEPYSVHIKYKSSYKKNKVGHAVESNIVKVPFYGDKLFEVEIWVKDATGRKFANISSLNVHWEVSDNSIAKPKDYRSFITHIDGSAGYRKVSRNFQQFEMTGHTGALKISTKLKEYLKDMLAEENICNVVHFKEITQSIELQLVSLRDIYDGTSENMRDISRSAEKQNDDGTCDGDSCQL